MANTKQINIDVTTNQAAVMEFNNGMPVPPAKSLDIDSLSPADKQKVDDVIKIIEDNAQVPVPPQP